MKCLGYYINPKYFFFCERATLGEFCEEGIKGDFFNERENDSPHHKKELLEASAFGETVRRRL